MFTILENFRETILFILLGNIASSLKFEFICRKIGLVLFAKELDTHELFHCLIRDCNYRDEIQKQIALQEFQSSEALGDFWSFLKLYMYIQIDFMYTIRSHKKRRAKYQTEMLSQIPNEQFRYKQCFQQKKTLTGDNDDQKFNCDNADGHSQAGNWGKKLSPSWIRKTSRKKKSNEKRLETLFTHRRLNIYLHKLPFIVDLTDIKSWIVFKFS